MYEILACSFLLNLICSENNCEGSFVLQQLLDHTLGGEGHSDTTPLIEQLKMKKRGGREHLLMFITGLAGARKSTGIKVA